jgi:hypothetical protein
LIESYVFKEGQRLWWCAGLTYVFTSLQDCDDSGYITVDNLECILGPDVSKSYLASIIDEADIVRDK